MTRHPQRPVVYSDAAHVSVMIESLTRFIETGASEIIADDDVRQSLHQLSSVAARRLRETSKHRSRSRRRSAP